MVMMTGVSVVLLTLTTLASGPYAHPSAVRLSVICGSSLFLPSSRSVSSPKRCVAVDGFVSYCDGGMNIVQCLKERQMSRHPCRTPTLPSCTYMSNPGRFLVGRLFCVCYRWGGGGGLGRRVNITLFSSVCVLGVGGWLWLSLGHSRYHLSHNAVYRY